MLFSEILTFLKNSKTTGCNFANNNSLGRFNKKISYPIQVFAIISKP
jgi:hypothetical protein